MKTYWLSFRIANDADYDTRYDKLVETIRTSASKWWLETTAFLDSIAPLLTGFCPYPDTISNNSETHGPSPATDRV
jgi:hypothetical protein